MLGDMATPGADESGDKTGMLLPFDYQAATDVSLASPVTHNVRVATGRLQVG